MAYADFTLETVEATLHLQVQLGESLPEPRAVDVPRPTAEQLKHGMQLALLSDKARGEFIVAPILLATRRLADNAVTIWSGSRFDVDPIIGLSGECDFLLAVDDREPLLVKPFLTVVQAKKGTVEASLGPCIAQMVAARRYNKRPAYDEQGKPRSLVTFGCVTTGEVWQFLSLGGNVVTIETKRLYISNVAAILATLVAIAKCATG